MSGTGPKADGPRYLQSFYKSMLLKDRANETLAVRTDKLVPLVSSKTSIGLIDEVVVYFDTTASGGNAALLAEVS